MEAESEVEDLNKQAEFYKDKRDELNSKVKELINARNETEDLLKAKIDEAVQHKNKRDELNSKVKELRPEKDKVLNEIKDISDRISNIKKEILPTNNMTIGSLKKRLKKLEFKQMTTVLTPQQEKELIEEVAKLNKEIKMREDLLSQNSAIKDENVKIKDLRNRLRDLNKEIRDVSDEAQREHEAMVEIFKQADEIRGRLEGIRDGIAKTREDADKAHEEHIKLVDRINDLERKTRDEKKKKKKAVEEKKKEEIGKEAEEIFAKFQSGETLSTEDILMLQKAGIL
jgi:uncharacterized coiled-coil DUF342 family protein